MIRGCTSCPIHHLNSELRGVVHSTKHGRFIFPDHVIWKSAPTLTTLWGLQKGSGDCKNVGADRATQIAPTCANHFVSPQRVWGRDDIVRPFFRAGCPRSASP